MVHCAYDSCELVNSCPTKIQTVGSYGSKLLIGCTDGSLLVYQADASIIDRSTSSDLGILNSELRKDPYIVERELKGFSKKPLVAMEVLRSSELMLFLSDSISFHRLPSLETTAVITKSKGANAYSWDDRRGFLCFARQKRVCIFRHDGGRGFVEVKEFGVPDIVKSMAWCGENICLGIRREYTILNTTTGTLNEVFPSGRIAPPLVIPLPSGELLLGKDNIGVFVDHNGKLLQEGRICWSDAPVVVMIQKPYAVALLSRHIEIRSLRVPYPLVQTITLRNGIHLLECTNSIVVALQNSLYGLFPVPLGAQIVQLTASGNFEEALALCKILPPEDEKLRIAKEGAIHLRYGHHLFEKGSYEDAMEHFFESQVDIIHVLSLYPSIVLPKSNTISELEESEVGATDGPYLSRVLSGGSDEFDGSPSSQPSESDENAALESKKLNHNTFMALIKFLHKKRSNIIDKAATEGTNEVILGTVGDMFMSYGSGRTKVSNKAKNISNISSSAREMAAILDTALLQALILTGQMSLATDLLKGVNHCDIKICEDILQKTNYYAALLELYKSNGNHREALKLLHHLVHESESGQPQTGSMQKFNPEMILEYLKPLCGTDPMLVLEFSMLVLQSCPMKTIDLLLCGNIPADLVNSYLKEHAPDMQATYLEVMLKVSENGISRNLQNEIVQIYFSDVIDWQANVASQNKWNENLDCPSRKKLLNALKTVPGYSPDALLRRLPTEALYEERAILLGKMNQHELALSIYVHRLNVPEMALSYCDRVHDAGINQAGIKNHRNIYLTLLQIYLNPARTTKNFERRIANVVTSQNSFQASSRNKAARQSRKIAQIEGAEETRISSNETDSGKSDVDEVNGEDAATIMLDEILDLLGRRWERINGAQALKLLPKETKLQNLVSFLCPLLRKSSEASRNFSVIKSLRQGENLQVKNSLYSLRKNMVKIENESMCSFCNKKIGTSVFAVFPNGETLVHFVCFRDSQNMKAVTGGSSLRKNI